MRAVSMSAWMVACPAVLVGVVLACWADERAGGDRRVHDLMERTHEGRRSPYGRLRQIVQGPGAAWPAIEQAVRGFDPMCRALLESPDAEIKGSADGYVDAVKEIMAAVKRRDAKGVADGIGSLGQSCGDCHFKGGVGGRLDAKFGSGAEAKRENDERKDDEREDDEREDDEREDDEREDDEREESPGRGGRRSRG